MDRLAEEITGISGILNAPGALAVAEHIGRNPGYIEGVLRARTGAAWVEELPTDIPGIFAASRDSGGAQPGASASSSSAVGRASVEKAAPQPPVFFPPPGPLPGPDAGAPPQRPGAQSSKRRRHRPCSARRRDHRPLWRNRWRQARPRRSHRLLRDRATTSSRHNGQRSELLRRRSGSRHPRHTGKGTAPRVRPQASGHRHTFRSRQHSLQPARR